jgi:Cu-Zn family superoxide dismutase
MKRRAWAIAATTVVALGVVNVQTADANLRIARATLTTAQGNQIGSVMFVGAGRHTDVVVRLNSGGLTDVEVDVFHAFHVHANDDPANGEGCVATATSASNTWFTSVDGHFNPTGQSHGHHAGDMPVIYFNSDGDAQAKFRLDYIAPADLLGRAVILHAGPDNYGNIPVGTGATQYTANTPDAVTGTNRTGNAGDRVACGVIR